MATNLTDDAKRTSVRERYGEIAREGSSCCGSGSEGAGGSCCGSSGFDNERISAAIGYTITEMEEVPEGSNLGLGCGNPTALAGITPGETVVDLGSGAGFDCFLASKAVGPNGRVIGVDMTADMISRARANAEKGGYANVEFRLGEIEHLPLADASVDLIISNCVINLSPDKAQVFAEANRVLKPGGRLMVSDIVTDGELPESVRNDPEAYGACIGGAIEREVYLGLMRDAGFEAVNVETEKAFGSDLFVTTGNETITVPDGVVVSISAAARKPRAG